MKVNKQDFFTLYMEGNEQVKSNNLAVDEKGFITNYGVRIGKFLFGTLYVNVTNYSSTTSRNQNILKQMADEYDKELKEVTEEEMDELAETINDYNA